LGTSEILKCVERVSYRRRAYGVRLPQKGYVLLVDMGRMYLGQRVTAPSGL
jgi:hypothetical protein